ncbi:hypothetical protein QF026_008506 [Streptomyces aurantiacus]|uniref:hypothetical protein n=1 Tax=Streptomyces aurantiacus TaxID=47760 RepID=UPI00278CA652|nr:hypothetical protein [Streptomyces aurantiacus]MDQ0780040.1 hypothetical protein [Streptomyces aurantiacus]
MVTNALLDFLTGLLGNVLGDLAAGLLLLALGGPGVKMLPRKKTRDRNHNEQPPQ